MLQSSVQELLCVSSDTLCHLSVPADDLTRLQVASEPESSRRLLVVGWWLRALHCTRRTARLCAQRARLDPALLQRQKDATFGLSCGRGHGAS